MLLVALWEQLDSLVSLPRQVLDWQRQLPEASHSLVGITSPFVLWTSDLCRDT